MAKGSCKRAFLIGKDRNIELVGPADWVDERVDNLVQYGHVRFDYEEEE